MVGKILQKHMWRTFIFNNIEAWKLAAYYQCDALRDLVLFVLKNVKNTHGGVSLQIKLQARSLQLY